MKGWFLTGIAFAALATAPDLAAHNWSGCDIGANIGAAQSRSNFTSVMDSGSYLAVPADLAATSAAGTGSATGTGFTGGGQIGCDWQTDSTVVGLEADINAFSTEVINTQTGMLTTGNSFSVSNSLKANRMVTVRPRWGAAFGRSLLYVTGGAAFTGVRYTQRYSDTSAASGASSVSKTKVGWAAGAGWEHAFANNWSAKIEYLYTHFTSFNTDTVVASTSGGANVLHGSAGLRTQMIRVGINYKFGGRE